tara:strand:- start:765 stop:1046 length:282 start_codon:yes stop_codon:yes gene_type:complete
MSSKSIRVSLEEADEILSRAYDNGYRLLFNEISYRGLELECLERDEDMYLTYFRDDGPMLSDMEDMLYWYEGDEEYERCAKIRDYIRDNFDKD